MMSKIIVEWDSLTLLVSVVTVTNTTSLAYFRRDDVCTS